MKTSKFFPGICLALTLVMGLHLPAWAALVNSPDQPIILQGNSGSDTSGILSFTKLSRVKADGTIVPFSLPANKALVVTWLQLNVNAVDTLLATNADLRMGPFYSRGLTMTNGAAGFTEGHDPGFVISSQGFNNSLYNNFYTINLKNDAIIPGTINVRLIGYLAPVP